MATTDQSIHPDVLELAALVRPAWGEISDTIPASHPRCEGDEGGDGKEEGSEGKKGEGGEEGKPGDSDDADGKEGADASGKGEPDWKRESRKHERRAKSEKDRGDKLEAELEKIKASGRSDQEKLIEQAKADAKKEAQAEAEKERRGDRLEGAVLRLAAKGVQVGKGDDAKTVRFDDPEDALVFVERAVARGEIPESTLYDDKGRPKQDVLVEELVDLLERKPALAAGAGTKADGPGDGDAGKGKGRSSSEDMNDLMRRARNR